MENKFLKYLLPISILLSAVIVTAGWIYTVELKMAEQQAGGNAATASKTAAASSIDIAKLETEVLPSAGFTLPISWGDFGSQLEKDGVIDKDKFYKLYADRGFSTEELKKLLEENNDTPIFINQQNAGLWLNLFWALGLGSKNPILEQGEMADEKYGGAGNFASTGGWTLAKGDAMKHYSHHQFFNLTDEQQTLVDRVSKGIYRPCCGNSTHFPDCNHGMAMLGLLEMLAFNNVPENEMYQTALQVNSYWFPDTYLNIAKYLNGRGIAWKDANAQEILGADYSSGSGYKKILKAIEPSVGQQSGGCGV